MVEMQIRLVEKEKNKTEEEEKKANRVLELFKCCEKSATKVNIILSTLRNFLSTNKTL